MKLWCQSPAGKIPPNPAKRPFGEDHFNDLTPEQQDETFGPTVAQALRDGYIQLSDLVSKTGDFLARTPIDELDIPTE